MAPAGFDLVTARAVLHHPRPWAAVVNLIASARPGGTILRSSLFPGHSCRPPGYGVLDWLAGLVTQHIDYHRPPPAGNPVPVRLADLGATAESALYHGGSPWAEYWRQTVAELRTRLEDSGLLAARSIDRFLARCADPAW